MDLGLLSRCLPRRWEPQPLLAGQGAGDRKQAGQAGKRGAAPCSGAPGPRSPVGEGPRGLLGAGCRGKAGPGTADQEASVIWRGSGGARNSLWPVLHPGPALLLDPHGAEGVQPWGGAWLSVRSSALGTVGRGRPYLGVADEAVDTAPGAAAPARPPPARPRGAAAILRGAGCRACGYLSHRATPPPAHKHVPALFPCSRAHARGTHTRVPPCACSSLDCESRVHMGEAAEGGVGVPLPLPEWPWHRVHVWRGSVCLPDGGHGPAGPRVWTWPATWTGPGGRRRPLLPWPRPCGPATVTDDAAPSRGSSPARGAARAPPRASVPLHGAPGRSLERSGTPPRARGRAHRRLLHGQGRGLGQARDCRSPQRAQAGGHSQCLGAPCAQGQTAPALGTATKTGQGWVLSSCKGSPRQGAVNRSGEAGAREQRCRPLGVSWEGGAGGRRWTRGPRSPPALTGQLGTGLSTCDPERPHLDGCHFGR